MCVETEIACAGDLGSLLTLLSRQCGALARPLRQTAAFILGFYAVQHEFPSVRDTARAIHDKPSNVQRSQKTLILAWRRTLFAAGLYP
jgi:hypothetical protein